MYLMQIKELKDIASEKNISLNLKKFRDCITYDKIHKYVKSTLIHTLELLPHIKPIIMRNKQKYMRSG
jgi:hypothetical protein